MIDEPFGDNGQRFARSYSQTSPYRDQPNRQQRVMQTALGGSAGIAASPYSDYIPVQDAWDMSGQTPEQQAAMARATTAQRSAQNAGFAADGAHLAANQGRYQPGYQSQWSPSADPTPDQFGGRRIDPSTIGRVGVGGAFSQSGQMRPQFQGLGPNDHSVSGAQQMLQNAYQQSLGRSASPDELSAQLAGQGLKPGDRWVGSRGLGSVISSIQQSPEALAHSQRAQAPGQTPQTSAAPGGLGSFAHKLEGFDAGKLQSGHDSPKYQFARVMSQFDPKGGVTPELLAALNALGLGTVTGQGDKIRVGGAVDPRFEGVTEFDLIRDLENGGGWQWGALNDSRPGMGGAPQGGGFGSTVGQGSVNPNVSISSPDGARSHLDQILAALAGNPALRRALQGTL